MSKILMILDQIQAGAGGKEKADLPPAGKSLPLGPGIMMEPFLNDLKIIATLYCGDEYFINNSEEVSNKMCAMVKKLNPDIVICDQVLTLKTFLK